MRGKCIADLLPAVAKSTFPFQTVLHDLSLGKSHTEAENSRRPAESESHINSE